MATIEWKYPIETIHGRLKKGEFGAAKRSSANAKGEHYNFSVVYGKRSTLPDEEEVAKRNKFKAIAQAVATRRNNAQQRAQDALAFEAQSTYKTMTKYLWSVCTAAWVAANTTNDDNAA